MAVRKSAYSQCAAHNSARVLSLAPVSVAAVEACQIPPFSLPMPRHRQTRRLAELSERAAREQRTLFSTHVCKSEYTQQ